MKGQDTIIKRNQKVFNDTLSTAHLHEYEKPVLLDISLADAPVRTRKSKILIINDDMLDAAHEISKQGILPLLVYSTENTGPRNKVEAGIMNDDGELYRRSNITAVRENVFPLNGSTVLYPKLAVYKSNTYATQDPFHISVLAMTPVFNPQIISMIIDKPASESQHKHNSSAILRPEYQNACDYKKMRDMIHFMFSLATERDYKCIIVRDFGCGPNIENPLPIICDIFNEAIAKYNVPLVIFCIQRPFYERHLKGEYENYTFFREHITR